jgi:hypothetical protein
MLVFKAAKTEASIPNEISFSSLLLVPTANTCHVIKKAMDSAHENKDPKKSDLFLEELNSTGQ